MRNLLVAIVVLAASLLESPGVGHLSHQRSVATQSLSYSEEADLSILVPHIVCWIAIWDGVIPCLIETAIRDLDLAESLRSNNEGLWRGCVQVSATKVFVEFSDLHLRLRFSRLQFGGLGYIGSDRFCEASMADAERARQERLGSEAYEASVKRIRSMTETLKGAFDGIKEDEAIPTSEERFFSITFRSVVNDAIGRTTDHASDNQVQALYESVIAEVTSAPKASCVQGTTLELQIPSIRIGDPAVFVAVKEIPWRNAKHSESIAYVQFIRDPSSGAYSVGTLRRLGLRDQVRALSTLIAKQQPRKEIRVCYSR